MFLVRSWALEYGSVSVGYEEAKKLLLLFLLLVVAI